jgi:tRNA modification GTPase
MVSDIPGTTRDVLEVALDLDGYPVTLIDTAGLRQAADILEAEGIRRALRRAETADLRIVLVDALAWPHVDQQTKAQLGPDSVLVVSRADLNPDQSGAMLEGRPVLSVSARTGRGVEELVAMIAGVAKTKLDLADGLAPTRARHRQALEQAAADLGRAIEARSLELLAEDLRLGIRALGRITGRVDVEDMLDRLFAEFCIGK